MNLRISAKIAKNIQHFIFWNDIKFIEIFVKASIDTCEKRDPKGFYKKAKSGEIKEFTGISAPYEEPLNPEITLDADTMSIEEEVNAVLNYLNKVWQYVENTNWA